MKRRQTKVSFFFHRPTFCVSIVIQIWSITLLTVASYSTSEPGPKLINTSFFLDYGMIISSRMPVSTLKCKKRAVHFAGITLKFLRICVLCVRAWLKVVKNLASDGHLGTSLIVPCIWSWLLSEHHVVRLQSSPVSILSSLWKAISFFWTPLS